MKPFKLQWQNTHQALKPWPDFTPPIKIIAQSDSQAIEAAGNILRQEHDWLNQPYPIRAIEISWEEYERIK